VGLGLSRIIRAAWVRGNRIQKQSPAHTSAFGLGRLLCVVLSRDAKQAHQPGSRTLHWSHCARSRLKRTTFGVQSVGPCADAHVGTPARFRDPVWGRDSLGPVSPWGICSSGLESDEARTPLTYPHAPTCKVLPLSRRIGGNMSTCSLVGCRKRVPEGRKVYCSHEHSRLARSRRYEAAHKSVPAERTCEHRGCDVRFTPKRSDGRFCSTHCKNAEAWAVRQDRGAQ
jgi:hypothetical protein